MNYDFAILGGGAAGLSLALELVGSELQNKSILIVEKDAKTNPAASMGSPGRSGRACASSRRATNEPGTWRRCSIRWYAAWIFTNTPGPNWPGMP